MLAPICLFVYNRLSEVKRAVDALTHNYLAPKSDLFVFSDGAKSDNAKVRIDEVRKYLKTIDGFQSVQIIESEKNKGLANSIIDGVTEVIEEYGKVIVVEDDLISSRNFLDFMNQALDFYSEQERVFSVSGYTMNLPSLKSYKEDSYLGLRASSWGWGTWNDRWAKVDWKATDYSRTIYNPIKHYAFTRGGSDMPYMLWKQMNGKIDSWAIRWCYFQHKHDLLTVFPSQSKIESIGFGADATHTQNTNRFDTYLDTEESRSFVFSNNMIPESKLMKEFRRKFSVWNRVKNRLKCL